MTIADDLKRKWQEWTISPECDRLLRQLPNRFNEFGYDGWGMSPFTVRKIYPLANWFFENYFKIRIYGIGKVPSGRVMLVGNHSGQLPLDGGFLFMALLKYGQPPRLLRGMIERFFPRVPFVGTWLTRCGQTVGTPENCRQLLEDDEAVLVFPEGVKGSGKMFWQRYQLQRFGNGFMRLALETNTPIVPVAVIGAEETYPAFYNVKPLAKLLGIPYFPITPFWPFLGLFGALPLPCQIHLHFGDPITFAGEFDEPEWLIAEKVGQVAEGIQKLIDHGLRERKHIFGD